MIDRPTAAWVQEDPDDDELMTMFGIRLQGNDGERIVERQLSYGHQTEDDTFALLPMDLYCEQVRDGATVTVSLVTPEDGVAVLAATVTLPTPDANLSPGVVVIDSEGAERAADFIAAVEKGESAYCIIGPDIE
ncbi:MAG TPA: hypothetical protein VH352_00970 [Pseudonocardiaceae bacterium]|jgi:hypothetical protein|nr:hypothetical protein [Pseudonocardiaceae bacterium]